MIRLAFWSGSGGQRVGRQRGAGGRVDADDGAVEGHRVAGRAQILATQRAAFGGGRGQGGADPARRVAARVERGTVLAPVGEVEAGPVAAGGVQGPVGPELQVAHRVARVLLAPVLDQHLLGTGHQVPGGGQARQPPRDHAAVAGGSRWGRARVGVAAGRPPAGCRGGRAQLVVVGVEDVDVGLGREVGVEDHAEQPAVPEVVDVGPQVGEDVRSGVGQAVEDLDDAALLGHEHAPVSREADDGGVGQPTEMTVDSWNPAGSVAAWAAGPVESTRAVSDASISARESAPGRVRRRRAVRPWSGGAAERWWLCMSSLSAVPARGAGSHGPPPIRLTTSGS